MNKKQFIVGNFLGLFIVAAYLMIFQKDNSLKLLDMYIIPTLQEYTTPITIGAIIAAWIGGLSAGYYTYNNQKKARKEEKREDKYHEHRNAIVQLEHELIEARVNMARNLSAYENSFSVSDRYRLILRFFPIEVSRGLDLKILNLDLLNKYSELMTQLNLINSDFEYTKGLVIQIREVLTSPEFKIGNPQSTALMESLVKGYASLIKVTYNLCQKADNDMADLLSMCMHVLGQDNKPLIKEYTKNPAQIPYIFTKKEMKRIKTRIHAEETKSGTEKNPKSQFSAPYFDLKPSA